MTINYNLQKIISKHVLILFTTLCLWIICLNAYSLSLGKMKIQSSLNQPLVASIELLNADGVLCEEILPNLASGKDFKLAKLKQPDFLTDIEFQVVAETKNKKIISISTNSVIQNPSIDLLVEVHWPMGRILKEYSILLNPLSADANDSITPKTAPVVKKKIILKDKQIISKELIKSNDFNTYYTNQGDTLWSIAAKFHKKIGLSIPKTMEEIFKNNPDAFIDNNKTQIKSGYKLILPNNNLKFGGVPKSNLSSQGDKKTTNIVTKSPINKLNQEPKAIIASNVNLPEEGSKTAVQSDAELMRAQILELKNQINKLNQQNKSTDEPSAQPVNAEQEKPEKNPEVVLDTIENSEKADVKKQSNRAKEKLNDAKDNNQNSQNIKSDDSGFSFGFYFLFIVIILAIIGTSILFYYKLKKNKQVKDSAESSDNEIVEDYSSEDKIPQTSNGNKETTNPIEKADEFISKQETDKAVLILNQALSINPNDVDINFKLLELYCDIGDQANAQKILTNCIKFNDAKLNSKLDALKSAHPDIFANTAGSKWDINNNDVDLGIIDEDDLIGGDISEYKSDKKDELSFLEDSDLIGDSIIDEIARDDSPSLSEISKKTTKETGKDKSTEATEDDEAIQGSKLDLAKGYIEMGDDSEANKLLAEIMESGTEDEQQQAKILSEQIENNEQE